MPLTPRQPAERFWPKVRREADGCWIWTGALSDTGYGSFNAGLRNGARYWIGAHRFAYEQVVGAIPSGLVLDHTCGVRHCVNPDHLEAVTQRENAERGDSPTAIAVRTNTCSRGHSLADAYRNGIGRRTCRECHRARTRRLRARGKDFSRPTRRAVGIRSGGRCEVDGVSPATHCHHRQLRGHGDHSAANALHVCAACHREIHDHVEISYRNGWLVPSTADAAGITVVLHFGSRLLTRDGTYIEAAA